VAGATVVKSILTRVPTVLSAAAIFASAARPRELRPYAPFVKSICAGTIHFGRKVISANFFSVLSRLRNSVSDESLIAMIIGHFEVVRVLNHNNGRALTRRYGNYANKYVTEYLAKSFDKKTRREILKFHHRYLADHVTDSFYEQILQGRSNLWTETIDGNCYAISISFNPDWHSEGDISLTFDKNDVSLYEVSFTIVPGRLIGCAAAQALLVGRVQGRKGQAEPIRVGTRACHDIAPPNLLLAAVQSVAGVLGIEAIAGVSNDEQLAKSVYDAAGVYFDYDTFWETYLVEKRGARIYTIPVPFPEKPIKQVSSAHRRRARNKRRLKKQIADRVGAAFAEKFSKA